MHNGGDQEVDEIAEEIIAKIEHQSQKNLPILKL